MVDLLSPANVLCPHRRRDDEADRNVFGVERHEGQRVKTTQIGQRAAEQALMFARREIGDGLDEDGGGTAEDGSQETVRFLVQHPVRLLAPEHPRESGVARLLPEEGPQTLQLALIGVKPEQPHLVCLEDVQSDAAPTAPARLLSPGCRQARRWPLEGAEDGRELSRDRGVCLVARQGSRRGSWPVFPAGCECSPVGRGSN